MSAQLARSSLRGPRCEAGGGSGLLAPSGGAGGRESGERAPASDEMAPPERWPLPDDMRTWAPTRAPSGGAHCERAPREAARALGASMEWPEDHQVSGSTTAASRQRYSQQEKRRRVRHRRERAASFIEAQSERSARHSDATEPSPKAAAPSCRKQTRSSSIASSITSDYFSNCSPTSSATSCSRQSTPAKSQPRVALRKCGTSGAREQLQLVSQQAPGAESQKQQTTIYENPLSSNEFQLGAHEQHCPTPVRSSHAAPQRSSNMAPEAAGEEARPAEGHNG